MSRHNNKNIKDRLGLVLGRRLLLGLLGSMFLASPLAAQQSYPNRPIRIVVGFPAGSSSDVAARVAGQKISDILKTPVVIENRPGGSSDVAAKYVASADPDGYTLYLSTVANVINFASKGQASVDIATSMTPLGQIGEVPNILVVHPSVDAKTVGDVIRLAKAKPGDLTYASAGSGSALHMAAELFSAMADVRMLHIPYQGSAAAMSDLLSGRTSIMFAPASTVLELIKTGKLRAIASTGSKRSDSTPDLPTISEEGLKGFESSVWFGLMSPNGLPKDVSETLEKAVLEASKSSDVKAQFAPLGIDAIPHNRADFTAYIRAEADKWAKVIQNNGLKLN